METSFFDFLQRVTPRYLQEREVGLDIYLSGPWAWVPIVLGIAAATIFVLALFHFIPLRRHSIPLVVALGVVALGVGLLGTYLNYRRVEFDESGAIILEKKSAPRVVTEGKGRAPEIDGHGATLLAIPLLVSGAVLVASIGAGGFLIFFGGRDRKGEDDEDEAEDE